MKPSRRMAVAVFAVVLGGVAILVARSRHGSEHTAVAPEGANAQARTDLQQLQARSTEASRSRLSPTPAALAATSQPQLPVSSATSRPGADLRDVPAPEPDNISGLRKMLQDDADPDQRMAAVMLLVASEDPEAVPLLMQALSDADQEVRLAALNALADFGNDPPVEAIGSALKDPAPEVRLEALNLLADIGGTRARRAIETALSDPDDDVRALAESILALEE